MVWTWGVCNVFVLTLFSIVIISLGEEIAGLCVSYAFEPSRDKTNKMACAPSEDSDQPKHSPSLIRVFTVRMKKVWVLSYLLSAVRRLWMLFLKIVSLQSHPTYSIDNFNQYFHLDLFWTLSSCVRVSCSVVSNLVCFCSPLHLYKARFY